MLWIISIEKAIPTEMVKILMLIVFSPPLFVHAIRDSNKYNEGQ
jgi:hypothetical protein